MPNIAMATFGNRLTRFFISPKHPFDGVVARLRYRSRINTLFIALGLPIIENVRPHGRGMNGLGYTIWMVAIYDRLR